MSQQHQSFVYIKNVNDGKRYKFVSKSEICNLTGARIDTFLKAGVGIKCKYRVTHLGVTLHAEDVLRGIGVQNGSTLFLEPLPSPPREEEELEEQQQHHQQEDHRHEHHVHDNEKMEHEREGKPQQQETDIESLVGSLESNEPAVIDVLPVFFYSNRLLSMRFSNVPRGGPPSVERLVRGLPFWEDSSSAFEQQKKSLLIYNLCRSSSKDIISQEQRDAITTLLCDGFKVFVLTIDVDLAPSSHRSSSSSFRPLHNLVSNSDNDNNGDDGDYQTSSPNTKTPRSDEMMKFAADAFVTTGHALVRHHKHTFVPSLDDLYKIASTTVNISRGSSIAVPVQALSCCRHKDGDLVKPVTDITATTAVATHNNNSNAASASITSTTPSVTTIIIGFNAPPELWHAEQTARVELARAEAASMNNVYAFHMFIQRSLLLAAESQERRFMTELRDCEASASLQRFHLEVCWCCSQVDETRARLQIFAEQQRAWFLFSYGAAAVREMHDIVIDGVNGAASLLREHLIKKNSGGKNNVPVSLAFRHCFVGPTVTNGSTTPATGVVSLTRFSVDQRATRVTRPAPAQRRSDDEPTTTRTETKEHRPIRQANINFFGEYDDDKLYSGNVLVEGEDEYNSGDDDDDDLDDWVEYYQTKPKPSPSPDPGPPQPPMPSPSPAPGPGTGPLPEPTAPPPGPSRVPTLDEMFEDAEGLCQARVIQLVCRYYQCIGNIKMENRIKAVAADGACQQFAFWFASNYPRSHDVLELICSATPADFDMQPACFSDEFCHACEEIADQILNHRVSFGEPDSYESDTALASFLAQQLGSSSSPSSSPVFIVNAGHVIAVFWDPDSSCYVGYDSNDEDGELLISDADSAAEWVHNTMGKNIAVFTEVGVGGSSSSSEEDGEQKNRRMFFIPKIEADAWPAFLVEGGFAHGALVQDHFDATACPVQVALGLFLIVDRRFIFEASASNNGLLSKARARMAHFIDDNQLTNSLFDEAHDIPKKWRQTFSHMRWDPKMASYSKERFVKEVQTAIECARRSSPRANVVDEPPPKKVIGEPNRADGESEDNANDDDGDCNDSADNDDNENNNKAAEEEDHQAAEEEDHQAAEEEDHQAAEEEDHHEAAEEEDHHEAAATITPATTELLLPDARTITPAVLITKAHYMDSCLEQYQQTLSQYRQQLIEGLSSSADRATTTATTITTTNNKNTPAIVSYPSVKPPDVARQILVFKVAHLDYRLELHSMYLDVARQHTERVTTHWHEVELLREEERREREENVEPALLFEHQQMCLFEHNVSLLFLGYFSCTQRDYADYTRVSQMWRDIIELQFRREDHIRQTFCAKCLLAEEVCRSATETHLFAQHRELLRFQQEEVCATLLSHSSLAQRELDLHHQLLLQSLQKFVREILLPGQEHINEAHSAKHIMLAGAEMLVLHRGRLESQFLSELNEVCELNLGPLSAHSMMVQHYQMLHAERMASQMHLEHYALFHSEFAKQQHTAKITASFFASCRLHWGRCQQLDDEVCRAKNILWLYHQKKEMPSASCKKAAAGSTLQTGTTPTVTYDILQRIDDAAAEGHNLRSLVVVKRPATINSFRMLFFRHHQQHDSVDEDDALRHRRRRNNVFFVETYDDTICSAASVNNDGMLVKGPSGPLHNFLKQAGPKYLVVDFDELRRDEVVNLYSMFEGNDDSKIDGTPIDADTHVIGVVGSESRLLSQPDFKFRFDHRHAFEDPLPPGHDPFEQNHNTGTNDGDDDQNKLEDLPPKVNFHWQCDVLTQLQGRWTIRGDEFFWVRGLLEEEKYARGIELVNVHVSKQLEFFLQRCIAAKQLAAYQHGPSASRWCVRKSITSASDDDNLRKHVPPFFKFVSFASLSANYFVCNNIQPITVLNPSTASDCFCRFGVDKERSTLETFHGHLSAKNSVLPTLVLTRDLSRDAWLRLFDEARSQKALCQHAYILQVICCVSLEWANCHVVGGTVLPSSSPNPSWEDVVAASGATVTEDANHHHRHAAVPSACAIWSDDPDFTIAQFEQLLLKSATLRIVDMTDFHVSDIFSLITAHLDEDKMKFRFHNVEQPCLITSSNNNNNNNNNNEKPTITILHGDLSSALVDELLRHIGAHRLDLNTPDSSSNKLMVVTPTKKAAMAFHPLLPVYRHTQPSADEKEQLLLKATGQHGDAATSSIISEIWKKSPRLSFCQGQAVLWGDALRPHQSKNKNKNKNKKSDDDDDDDDLCDDESRMKEVQRRLDLGAPYVYLCGQTGCGKTQFVQRAIRRLRPGWRVVEGLSEIEAWVNATAVAGSGDENYCLLFLDEENLVDRQWTEFEGLCHLCPQNRRILHTSGKGGVTKLSHVTPRHRVIFAGNPATYIGRRPNSRLVARHGQMIRFGPLAWSAIEENAKTLLGRYRLVPQQQQQQQQQQHQHQQQRNIVDAVLTRLSNLYSELQRPPSAEGSSQSEEVLVTPRDVVSVVMHFGTRWENIQQNIQRDEQLSAVDVLEWVCRDLLKDQLPPELLREHFSRVETKLLSCQYQNAAINALMPSVQHPSVQHQQHPEPPSHDRPHRHHHHRRHHFHQQEQQQRQSYLSPEQIEVVRIMSEMLAIRKQRLRLIREQQQQQQQHHHHHHHHISGLNDCGISAIILEGVPAVGKTWLARFVFQAAGLSEEDTAPEEDRYVTVCASASSQARRTKFLDIFNRGMIAFVDEFNSMPIDEASLNAVLSGRNPNGELSAATRHGGGGGGFLLVGTQNPTYLEGRNAMSLALRRRMRVVRIEPYAAADVRAILINRPVLPKRTPRVLPRQEQKDPGENNDDDDAETQQPSQHEPTLAATIQLPTRDVVEQLADACAAAYGASPKDLLDLRLLFKVFDEEVRKHGF